MKRNACTPDEKAKMVLETLRGEGAVNEIALAHNIRPNMLSRWKREAESNLYTLSQDGTAKKRKEEKAHEADNFFTALAVRSKYSDSAGQPNRDTPMRVRFKRPYPHWEAQWRRDFFSKRQQCALFASYDAMFISCNADALSRRKSVNHSPDIRNSRYNSIGEVRVNFLKALVDFSQFLPEIFKQPRVSVFGFVKRKLSQIDVFPFTQSLPDTFLHVLAKIFVLKVRCNFRVGSARFEQALSQHRVLYKRDNRFLLFFRQISLARKDKTGTAGVGYKVSANFHRWTLLSCFRIA
ncbi:MAG: transposase [Oscillibacter sp.]|nr:transposase [Oscillibacter sp.]